MINLLSSHNDCCVYKVLAETFLNYKTVPNLNLPNIDDNITIIDFIYMPYGMNGMPYEKVFKGITLYHTLIYKIVL